MGHWNRFQCPIALYALPYFIVQLATPPVDSIISSPWLGEGAKYGRLGRRMVYLFSLLDLSAGHKI